MYVAKNEGGGSVLERFLAESPQAPNLSEKLARLAEAKGKSGV